ncbi:22441_t:CDS:2, partial [Dentiscutata erythropus]
NKGQKSIYNWFQPVGQKEYYEEEEYGEEIKYDSDVYDNMDDDNLIQIDKIDKNSDQEFQAISMDELDYIQYNKKQLICGKRVRGSGGVGMGEWEWNRGKE